MNALTKVYNFAF